MRNRVIRFIKAFTNESVKRLPYVVLILIVLIFGQSVQNNHTSKNLLMRVAQLSTDNKNLTQQNLQLLKQGLSNGSQNRLLAAQSVALNKCIGYTFATYTQTLTPIYFTDIDNCITASQKTSQTSASPVPQLSLPSPVASSSPQSVPVTSTPQPVISQPSPPFPMQPGGSFLEQALKTVDNFLGELGL